MDVDIDIDTNVYIGADVDLDILACLVEGVVSVAVDEASIHPAER